MTSTSPLSLGRRLDRDWLCLRTHRPSLARARSWQLLPAPVSVVDLDQFIVATQHDGGDEAERLLAGLVLVARSDDLAARIVVQRLLPGLVSHSSRYRFRCDGADPIDIAVPALWMAITRFAVERRPRHIAASLISDAISLGFRQSSRRSVPLEPMEPNAFDHRPLVAHEPTIEELAAVVALARQQGVAKEHLDLLRHLLRAGSPTQVAIDRGVSTRTVRNHRDRAIRRVRQAIAV